MGPAGLRAVRAGGPWARAVGDHWGWGSLGHGAVGDNRVPLLQVFDAAGSFLSYINTAADPLYGPQGLALTSDGHVVVADSGNHCFKAYRYLQ